MPSANDFQSVTASVFESPKTEVIVAKQAVLNEHGHEVKAAISQLPSNVANNLLEAYQEPSQNLVSQISNAIGTRESAINNAVQGNNLDQSWLNQGDQSANEHGKTLNESSLSAADDWN